MAQNIIVPKNDFDIIKDQSNLAHPVPYTGTNGLSILLSEMLSRDGVVSMVSAAAFKKGNFTNIPEGYANAPYTIPGAVQQNVLSDTDTNIVVQKVDTYIIGTPSLPMTTDFPLYFNKNSFSVGGITIPSIAIGQILNLVIYKNNNVTINGWGDNIGHSGFNKEYFDTLRVNVLTFRCIVENSIELVAQDYGVSLIKNWANLKTSHTDGLVSIINELYDLAFAGGAGPAGGDLTGNYPNPTIRSQTITSDKIQDRAILGIDIAEETLYGGASGNLAKKTISNYNIQDGTITNTLIEDRTITGSKLVLGTIGSSEIANYSIIENKLADNSVTKNAISAGAVTTEKIQARAITQVEIEEGAVHNQQIADGTIIGSTKIAVGTIEAANMGINSIAELSIQSNAVTTSKLSDGAVGLSKLDSLLQPNFKLGMCNFVLQPNSPYISTVYQNVPIEKFKIVSARVETNSTKAKTEYVITCETPRQAAAVVALHGSADGIISPVDIFVSSRISGGVTNTFSVIVGIADRNPISSTAVIVTGIINVDKL